jgi:hypothetical protein
MMRRCDAGAAWRRVSAAAGSILPAAALVLLPKCPMCLAVWLTAATGVGISATAAAWARGLLVVVWILAVAVGATLIVRIRVLRRMPVCRTGCTCNREKLSSAPQGTRAA